MRTYMSGWEVERVMSRTKEAEFLDFSGVGSPLKKTESIEHR